MKKTIPAREAEVVEVCDICQHEGYLQECLACGNSYCMIHRALIPGCWYPPQVGECCEDRDDVREIVRQHSEQIAPIIKARGAALAKLQNRQQERPPSEPSDYPYIGM